MVERGYKYFCSGDLDHIPEINTEVARRLNALIRDGFRVEFAEEGWE
jgi:hypothetical protein